MKNYTRCPPTFLGDYGRVPYPGKHVICPMCKRKMKLKCSGRHDLERKYWVPEHKPKYWWKKKRESP